MIADLIKRKYMFVIIILFLFVFLAINYSKPLWLYNRDGSIKQFGLGYKKKTIFPIWIFTIILAIICYLVVLFYVNYSNIDN
jgi:hypothetical protein